MVEVVAKRLDRDWWRPYARALAARFEQEVVHVRVIEVEMLDEDAT